MDDGWQNVIKKCPAKIMWKDKKFIDQAVKFAVFFAIFILCPEMCIV